MAGWLRGIVTVGAIVCAFGSTARAQTVKPYFLVIVDNSGSMTAGTGAGNNSCGHPHNRMSDAKCVVQNIVNGYGDVVFGLARYQTTCSGTCGGTCNATCTTACTCTYLDCSACNPSGAGCPAAGRTAASGEILVPIVDDNQASIISWVDYTCSSCPKTGANCELSANTWTPLAGSLRAARRYYEGMDPDFPTSPIAGDPYSGCRPISVILLTDGQETCAATTEAPIAATELRTTTFGGMTYNVKTYVIGLGIAAGDANIEAIATAGGTDAPGPYRGFYATDETTIALAFNQIIAGSVLVEICDGIDNNCNMLVDEGYSLGVPCSGDSAMGDQCLDGVTVCSADHLSTVCQDTVLHTEVCNGLDDNCNGIVDEPPANCMGCVPQPEICDGRDNNCDGRIDENVTRSCGSNVGVCTPGTQMCVEQTTMQPSGTWGPCSGVTPTPETCNNLDDDCDGVVDGITDVCGPPNVGQCVPGRRVCTAGVWGACTGGRGPQPEICDGLDNDCDGVVDNGDPGGGAACGTTCGAGIYHCIGGTLMCVAGSGGMPEVCNGIDDNCNGMIDEGIPTMGPCNPGGTYCMDGTLTCVSGGWQCVGGTMREPEICDCVDNDCDGVVDNPGAMLCPAGSSCVGMPYCQCARPCALSEFPCPSGYMCTDPANPAMGFCVPDPCAGITCPPLPTGEAQVCQNGTCVAACSIANCRAPLVCRPRDGMCVEDNCNGFPERCSPTELCIAGTCTSNPCAGVVCSGSEMFCRNGTCVASCADVTCPAGQSCSGGTCAADPCAGAMCVTTQVCDPATGRCVGNRCSGGGCPAGQICNPVSGACVVDPCLGVVCPGGTTEYCSNGDCFRRTVVMPDGGNGHDLVAPLGGCSCSVPGAARAGSAGWMGSLGSTGSGAIAGFLALSLLGLALGPARRRRRRSSR